MTHSLADRTLALAGLFQAVDQVRQTAHHGTDQSAATAAAIHSIFMIDAPNVEQVYGGTQVLHRGLEVLRAQLGDKSGEQRDQEVARYAVAVLFLERKLHRNPDMQAKLREGIAAARTQVDYFGAETHPSVIARLGDIYQQTISQLTPRVMVSGEPNVLQQSDNAAMIRALLLGAIRSAVLWRQCGGTRWQLLLRRRAMVEAALALRQP